MARFGERDPHLRLYVVWFMSPHELSRAAFCCRLREAFVVYVSCVTNPDYGFGWLAVVPKLQSLKNGSFHVIVTASLLKLVSSWKEMKTRDLRA